MCRASSNALLFNVVAFWNYLRATHFISSLGNSAESQRPCPFRSCGSAPSPETSWPHHCCVLTACSRDWHSSHLPHWPAWLAHIQAEAVSKPLPLRLALICKAQQYHSCQRFRAEGKNTRGTLAEQRAFSRHVSKQCPQGADHF